jgi:hypothetical protein
LKAALSYKQEAASTLISTIASNPEQSNARTNLEEVSKAIDAVTANDVNAVCTSLCVKIDFSQITFIFLSKKFVKRVGAGKHSLAAIGSLHELPRLDELAE